MLKIFIYKKALVLYAAKFKLGGGGFIITSVGLIGCNLNITVTEFWDSVEKVIPYIPNTGLLTNYTPAALIHAPITECNRLHLSSIHHIPYGAGYYLPFVKKRVFYLKLIIAFLILLILSIIYSLCVIVENILKYFASYIKNYKFSNESGRFQLKNLFMIL